MDGPPEVPSPEGEKPAEPPAEPTAERAPNPADKSSPASGWYFPDRAQPAAITPDAPAEAPAKRRPGAGMGVLTGFGLQVLAYVIFSLTITLTLSFFAALWGFVLVTVAAAALMFSRRWRRFATGALIVCVATWIVVIGPCISLVQSSPSLFIPSQ